MKLSEIGTKGLVVHTPNKEFKYLTERDWRDKSTRINGAMLDQLRTIQGVIAPVATNPPTVFVNFDALTWPQQDRIETPAGGRPAPAAEWKILVKEQDSIFAVHNGLFAPLDVGSRGDAAVLVRRGAVVATIPQNSIPSGSFCVLVNLALIKWG